MRIVLPERMEPFDDLSVRPPGCVPEYSMSILVHGDRIGYSLRSLSRRIAESFYDRESVVLRIRIVQGMWIVDPESQQLPFLPVGDYLLVPYEIVASIRGMIKEHSGQWLEKYKTIRSELLHKHGIPDDPA